MSKRPTQAKKAAQKPQQSQPQPPQQPKPQQSSKSEPEQTKQPQSEPELEPELEPEQPKKPVRDNVKSLRALLPDEVSIFHHILSNSSSSGLLITSNHINRDVLCDILHWIKSLHFLHCLTTSNPNCGPLKGLYQTNIGSIYVLPYARWIHKQDAALPLNVYTLSKICYDTIFFQSLHHFQTLLFILIRFKIYRLSQLVELALSTKLESLFSFRFDENFNITFCSELKIDLKNHHLCDSIGVDDIYANNKDEFYDIIDPLNLPNSTSVPDLHPAYLNMIANEELDCDHLHGSPQNEYTDDKSVPDPLQALKQEPFEPLFVLKFPQLDVMEFIYYSCYQSPFHLYYMFPLLTIQTPLDSIFNFPIQPPHQKDIFELLHHNPNIDSVVQIRQRFLPTLKLLNSPPKNPRPLPHFPPAPSLPLCTSPFFPSHKRVTTIHSHSNDTHKIDQITYRSAQNYLHLVPGSSSPTPFYIPISDYLYQVVHCAAKLEREFLQQDDHEPQLSNFNSSTLSPCQPPLELTSPNRLNRSQIPYIRPRYVNKAIDYSNLNFFSPFLSTGLPRQPKSEPVADLTPTPPGFDETQPDPVSLYQHYYSQSNFTSLLQLQNDCYQTNLTSCNEILRFCLALLCCTGSCQIPIFDKQVTHDESVYNPQWYRRENILNAVVPPSALTIDHPGPAKAYNPTTLSKALVQTPQYKPFIALPTLLSLLLRSLFYGNIDTIEPFSAKTIYSFKLPQHAHPRWILAMLFDTLPPILLRGFIFMFTDFVLKSAAVTISPKVFISIKPLFRQQLDNYFLNLTKTGISFGINFKRLHSAEVDALRHLRRLRLKAESDLMGSIQSPQNTLFHTIRSHFRVSSLFGFSEGGFSFSVSDIRGLLEEIPIFLATDVQFDHKTHKVAKTRTKTGYTKDFYDTLKLTCAIARILSRICFLTCFENLLTPNTQFVLNLINFCRHLRDTKCTQTLDYQFALAQVAHFLAITSSKVEDSLDWLVSHSQVQRALLSALYINMPIDEDLPNFFPKQSASPIQLHPFQHYPARLYFDTSPPIVKSDIYNLNDTLPELQHSSDFDFNAMKRINRPDDNTPTFGKLTIEQFEEEIDNLISYAAPINQYNVDYSDHKNECFFGGKPQRNSNGNYLTTTRKLFYRSQFFQLFNALELFDQLHRLMLPQESKESELEKPKADPSTVNSALNPPTLSPSNSLPEISSVEILEDKISKFFNNTLPNNSLNSIFFIALVYCPPPIFSHNAMMGIESFPPLGVDWGAVDHNGKEIVAKGDDDVPYGYVGGDGYNKFQETKLSFQQFSFEHLFENNLLAITHPYLVGNQNDSSLVVEPSDNTLIHPKDSPIETKLLQQNEIGKLLLSQIPSQIPIKDFSVRYSWPMPEIFGALFGSDLKDEEFILKLQSSLHEPLPDNATPKTAINNGTSVRTTDPPSRLSDPTSSNDYDEMKYGSYLELINSLRYGIVIKRRTKASKAAKHTNPIYNPHSFQPKNRNSLRFPKMPQMSNSFESDLPQSESYEVSRFDNVNICDNDAILTTWNPNGIIRMIKFEKQRRALLTSFSFLHSTDLEKVPWYLSYYYPDQSLFPVRRDDPKGVNFPQNIAPGSVLNHFLYNLTPRWDITNPVPEQLRDDATRLNHFSNYFFNYLLPVIAWSSSSNVFSAYRPFTFPSIKNQPKGSQPTKFRLNDSRFAIVLTETAPKFFPELSYRTPSQLYHADSLKILKLTHTNQFYQYSQHYLLGDFFTRNTAIIGMQTQNETKLPFPMLTFSEDLTPTTFIANLISTTSEPSSVRLHSISQFASYGLALQLSMTCYAIKKAENFDLMLKNNPNDHGVIFPLNDSLLLADFHPMSSSPTPSYGHQLYPYLTPSAYRSIVDTNARTADNIVAAFFRISQNFLKFPSSIEIDINHHTITILSFYVAILRAITTAPVTLSHLGYEKLEHYWVEILTDTPVENRTKKSRRKELPPKLQQAFVDDADFYMLPTIMANFTDLEPPQELPPLIGTRIIQTAIKQIHAVRPFTDDILPWERNEYQSHPIFLKQFIKARYLFQFQNTCSFFSTIQAALVSPKVRIHAQLRAEIGTAINECLESRTKSPNLDLSPLDWLYFASRGRSSPTARLGLNQLDSISSCDLQMVSSRQYRPVESKWSIIGTLYPILYAHNDGGLLKESQSFPSIRFYSGRKPFDDFGTESESLGKDESKTSFQQSLRGSFVPFALTIPELVCVDNEYYTQSSHLGLHLSPENHNFKLLISNSPQPSFETVPDPIQSQLGEFELINGTPVLSPKQFPDWLAWASSGYSHDVRRSDSPSIPYRLALSSYPNYPYHLLPDWSDAPLFGSHFQPVGSNSPIFAFIQEFYKPSNPIFAQLGFKKISTTSILTRLISSISGGVEIFPCSFDQERRSQTSDYFLQCYKQISTSTLSKQLIRQSAKSIDPYDHDDRVELTGLLQNLPKEALFTLFSIHHTAVLSAGTNILNNTTIKLEGLLYAFFDELTSILAPIFVELFGVDPSAILTQKIQHTGFTSCSCVMCPCKTRNEFYASLSVQNCHIYDPSSSYMFNLPANRPVIMYQYPKHPLYELISMHQPENPKQFPIRTFTALLQYFPHFPFSFVLFDNNELFSHSPFPPLGIHLFTKNLQVIHSRKNSPSAELIVPGSVIGLNDNTNMKAILHLFSHIIQVSDWTNTGSFITRWAQKYSIQDTLEIVTNGILKLENDDDSPGFSGTNFYGLNDHFRHPIFSLPRAAGVVFQNFSNLSISDAVQCVLTAAYNNPELISSDDVNVFRAYSYLFDIASFSTFLVSVGFDHLIAFFSPLFPKMRFIIEQLSQFAYFCVEKPSLVGLIGKRCTGFEIGTVLTLVGFILPLLCPIWDIPLRTIWLQYPLLNAGLVFDLNLVTPWQIPRPTLLILRSQINWDRVENISPCDLVMRKDELLASANEDSNPTENSNTPVKKQKEASSTNNPKPFFGVDKSGPGGGLISKPTVVAPKPAPVVKTRIVRPKLTLTEILSDSMFPSILQSSYGSSVSDRLQIILLIFVKITSGSVKSISAEISKDIHFPLIHRQPSNRSYKSSRKALPKKNTNLRRRILLGSNPYNPSTTANRITPTNLSPPSDTPVPKTPRATLEKLLNKPLPFQSRNFDNPNSSLLQPKKTLLHFAMAIGAPSIVIRLLLFFGASANLQDENNWTPIRWGLERVINGHNPTMVKFGCMNMGTQNSKMVKLGEGILKPGANLNIFDGVIMLSTRNEASSGYGFSKVCPKENYGLGLGGVNVFNQHNKKPHDLAFYNHPDFERHYSFQRLITQIEAMIAHVTNLPEMVTRKARFNPSEFSKKINKAVGIFPTKLLPDPNNLQNRTVNKNTKGSKGNKKDKKNQQNITQSVPVLDPIDDFRLDLDKNFTYSITASYLLPPKATVKFLSLFLVHIDNDFLVQKEKTASQFSPKTQFPALKNFQNGFNSDIRLCDIANLLDKNNIVDSIQAKKNEHNFLQKKIETTKAHIVSIKISLENYIRTYSAPEMIISNDDVLKTVDILEERLANTNTQYARLENLVKKLSRLKSYLISRKNQKNDPKKDSKIVAPYYLSDPDLVYVIDHFDDFDDTLKYLLNPPEEKQIETPPVQVPGVTHGSDINTLLTEYDGCNDLDDGNYDGLSLAQVQFQVIDPAKTKSMQLLIDRNVVNFGAVGDIRSNQGADLDMLGKMTIMQKINWELNFKPSFDTFGIPTPSKGFGHNRHKNALPFDLTVYKNMIPSFMLHYFKFIKNTPTNTKNQHSLTNIQTIITNLLNENDTLQFTQQYYGTVSKWHPKTFQNDIFSRFGFIFNPTKKDTETILTPENIIKGLSKMDIYYSYYILPRLKIIEHNLTFFINIYYFICRNFYFIFNNNLRFSWAISTWCKLRSHSDGNIRKHTPAFEKLIQDTHQNILNALPEQFLNGNAVTTNIATYLSHFEIFKNNHRYYDNLLSPPQPLKNLKDSTPIAPTSPTITSHHQAAEQPNDACCLYCRSPHLTILATCCFRLVCCQDCYDLVIKQVNPVAIHNPTVNQPGGNKNNTNTDLEDKQSNFCPKCQSPDVKYQRIYYYAPGEDIYQ